MEGGNRFYVTYGVPGQSYLNMEIHSGWYVGWGTLALINAGLAQGKHRSGLFWGLVSLLLGPIVTLILLFFPHRH